MSPSGKESIVYRFKGGNDGQNPAAGLVYANGELYGVTPTGGTSDPPYGTLFELSLSGHHTVLHDFGAASGGTDGELPAGGLTDLNGVLYGTAGGGTGHFGVVYSYRL